MEQLYNKQNPNKQQDVFIQFDVLKNKTREPEEEGPPVVRLEPAKREPAVKIMDYSKRGLVNREDVLNRLNKANRNPFLVKTNEQVLQKVAAPAPVPEPVFEKEPIMETGEPLIPEPEPMIAPTKTKFKLKIRNPEQIIKTGEPEKTGKTGKPEKTKKPEKKLDLTAAALSLQNVLSNLPKKRQSVQLKASSYYLNNRKLFIQKIADLYKDYRNEMVSQKDAVSCETMGAAGAEFDLLTHQKIVRDYLSLYTPYRGLLLYHGLGAGKCHSMNTPIIMADGTCKMVQDIKEGDLLMGDDSRPRTVLSLAKGRDKMYDIVPIKGEKYTVNQEHILCLRASGFPKISRNNHRANTNYNVQWIENNKCCSKTFTFGTTNEMEKKQEAEEFFENIQNGKHTFDNVLEIAVKDYLELSNKKKAFLKGYKVALDFEEKDLHIDPYAIGYWLGDGTGRSSDITCQDSTVLYYFANYLATIGLSLLYRSGYTYGITGNGKYNNNRFLNTLKEFDLLNNKHIPMHYKCNSRENRLQLLAGLLDSDGSLNTNGGFEFTQKNETLMNDVIYLARSLGFSCYKRNKNTTWTHKGEKKQGTAWRIHIHGNGLETIPTRIPRKRAPPRKQIKDVLVTGIKVQYVGEDDYYGFMLNGNCRYLIGDFTVTHNTCTSIAVAEGLKSDKKVFLMTPASLKSNYFNEIKKCGDELYKKNQNWQFISIDGQPAYPAVLAKVLSIQEASIKKAGGAWVVDVSKSPNFGTLTPKQQNEIDTQLNEMIRSKYTDINYNGLNMNIINRFTTNKTINPFDNAVVVIDEAHNFVSRIVNKLKDPKSISFLLYDLLMRANNARIVLLTGTPIINYPKEIAILFNILRGYIKTWSIQVTVGSQGGEINKERILELFHENRLATYDYVDYTGNVLTITRNPFGFVNTEKRGVAQGTKRMPNPKGGGGLSKKNVLNKNNKNKTKKHQKKEVLADTKSHLFSFKTPTSWAVMNGKGGLLCASEMRKGVKPIAYQIAPTLSTDEPIEPATQEESQESENQYINQNNELYKGGSGEFNKYNGVRLDEMGNYSDEEFIQRVVAILSKTYNVAERSIQLRLNKALPDGSVKAEENKFMETFIDVQSGDLKNVDLFQRRILGLTSYFRSAQEGLLPNFVLTTDKQVYHIEKAEMSEHQFGIYAKIRAEEADQEKRNTRKRAMVGTGDELFKIASTYRIFSRAACNFVFPDGIDRPVPTHGEDKEVDEMSVDVVPKEARQIENSYLGFGEDKEDHDEEQDKVGAASVTPRLQGVGVDEMAKMEDEATETANDNDYMRRIEQALAAVDAKDPVTNESVYLNEGALLDLSPKLLKVLNNLKDENNRGLHLIYSHFRTIEGIGILRLILLANGFAEFKLRKTLTNQPLPIETTGEGQETEEMERYQWNIVEDEDPKNRDKPKFVLYTGTESFEEREIILNIYNGKWEYVPKNIRAQLEAEQADKKNANKNMYGDVINAIMITSSGAEGINLTNTRFVHIVEPYWHMVRIDQVIGRARRICSHKDMPQELQTVKVFLYVTTLNEKQQTDEGNIELRNRDVSRIDRQTPITTDESLYETASLKNRINNQILYAVKQTAMDCKLYSGLSKTDEEPVVCYNFGEITSNNFGSIPAFEQDAELKEDLNVAKTKAAIKKVKIGDQQYAYNTATNDVYDLESFERAQKTGTEPIVVGKLVKQSGKYVLERI